MAQHFNNGTADSKEPTDNMQIKNLEYENVSEGGDWKGSLSDIEFMSNSGSERNAESEGESGSMKIFI